MKPATGLAGFIARLFSNGYRDAFITRLGVSLILGRFGIVGPLADFIGFFLRGFVGLLIEDGTFLIDIGIDSLKEGAKQAQFEKEAKAAYEKATAKIYDEVKKNEIRQEYLKIIARMGAVGNDP